MYRRTTRRRAWLVGITALTLAAPVALTGTAFASAPGQGTPSSTASDRDTAAQGERWVTEYTQKGDRSGAEVLFTGPDDGWVIGLDQDADDFGLPFVTHWDGKQWSDVPAADLSELTENQLRHSTAAALGPNDVWTAGDYGPYGTGGNGYGLGHWDGRTWSFTQGPAIGKDQVISGQSMERIGDQLWLASTAMPGDAQASFQGDVFVDRLVDGKWERLTLPDKLAKGNRTYDITGTSPDDVYLAIATQRDGKPTSQLAHWDGTSWTIADLPTPQDWADTGWYPKQLAVSHGRVYFWGRPQDDTERLFVSEDMGKSWKHAETPFIGVTDVEVHPESGDLLVSEVPRPFESETATFDGERWTTYPQPAVIDYPSTAFSAAYVPGTDRMVASILLANSQSQPDRATQYITTNKPVK